MNQRLDFPFEKEIKPIDSLPKIQGQKPTETPLSFTIEATVRFFM